MTPQRFTVMSYSLACGRTLSALIIIFKNMKILQVLPPLYQYKNSLVGTLWTSSCSVRTKLLLFLVLINDDSFSEWTKRWNWSEGVYLPGWMQQQIFLALFLLKLINLFWYYLIIRILVRLDNFFPICLSLTSILGPYAGWMLMTIDRMTKAKATMINKTKIPLNDLYFNILCKGHRIYPNLD